LNLCNLILWSRILLEELIVAQLVKKFIAFNGIVGSLPCSEESARRLYLVFLLSGLCPSTDVLK
jgi:hypothetical protein